MSECTTKAHGKGYYYITHNGANNELHNETRVNAHNILITKEKFSLFKVPKGVPSRNRAANTPVVCLLVIPMYVRNDMLFGACVQRVFFSYVCPLC